MWKNRKRKYHAYLASKKVHGAKHTMIFSPIMMFARLACLDKKHASVTNNTTARPRELSITVEHVPYVNSFLRKSNTNNRVYLAHVLLR